jgi:HEAT repeat protein
MMKRYISMMAAALVFASAATTNAQDIAARVRQVGNGTVRLTFASKPGVCGDGETFVSTTGMRDTDGRRTIFRDTRGSVSITTGSDDSYNWRNCEEGPVRVALEVDNGEVVDLRTYVGKSWPGNQDAMQVSARSAVSYFLQLVEHSNTRAAKRAMTPIILADSVNPAPDLLRIARNPNVAREARKSAVFWVGQIGDANTAQEIAGLIRDPDHEVAKSAIFAISQQRSDASSRTLLSAARNRDLPTEVRKSAVFWLGQIASDQATAGLKDVLTDENVEVKKSAVFALSQMRTEKSLDALMELARNSKDRELRKSAIFWLGQSNDPRVLAFFEEILLKKN